MLSLTAVCDLIHLLTVSRKINYIVSKVVREHADWFPQNGRIGIIGQTHFFFICLLAVFLLQLIAVIFQWYYSLTQTDSSFRRIIGKIEQLLYRCPIFIQWNPINKQKMHSDDTYAF